MGRRLCENLSDRGHDIVVLTRNPRPGKYRHVRWDGATVGAWKDELSGSVLINLAGELVDRRPTAANIELLTRSRVDPTHALVQASAGLAEPVAVWIQTSTLAIYGDTGELALTEDSPLADGPPQMAGVAKAWEAATNGANADRMVTLRTSIVLDRDTPALDRLAQLTRFGFGGRVASGRQWFSWIHIDDWLRIVHLAVESSPDPLEGTVLATAPGPVRNAELMASLRRILRRPPSPPTPAFVVRLGAWMLRTDPALGLTGRRATSKVLADRNFEFAHPTLDGALADLLG